MSWWKVSAILTLAAALGAWGCGSSSSSAGVTITITPTIASVITNRTQPFTPTVTGSDNKAVTWTVTCATGVTANTCGAIDATGLYTAPATIPTTTSGSTTTIAPTVTITATAQADTTKTAKATLTIVTGISINITPTTATVGTGETFPFSAVVNNPGCNITSTPTCENVNWSLSTTLTGIGSFISSSCTTPSSGQPVCTGVYKAPPTVPTPSTVILTATSVADTSVTATATVTVVTATVPTVTSVSPNTTALGGLFQDIYIIGTNFISTENVFINGAKLAPSFVTDVSSSVIRARIPDSILAVSPPSGLLQIGVSEQTGTGGTQTCTNASACQIAVMGVRPGIVGPTPDSIPQGTATVQSFSVDGGFFGTGSNPASPAVSATYNGQLRGIQLPSSQTIGSTRQLSVTIGGGSNSSDFTVPGLYPVAIKNATDPTKIAVANLAVQPNYNSGSSITKVIDLTATDGIGTSPSDVAVNPATGMAVVANTGSNNISLIDLTVGTPTVVANICTIAENVTPPCPTSTPSGPTSVSVDYVRNIAVVVNSTSKTIAVVDLSTRAVTSVFPVNPVPTAVADTPGAIGINPVTGRALIAMQRSNSGSGAGYGVLMDMTPTPHIAGVVSIGTGQKTRIAVEPHLNWAIATPGGLGSVGIVDLSLQSTNTITSVSRTSNVVQVTVQLDATTPPLAIQQSDAVLIQGVSVSVKGTPDTTLNGIFTVTAIGPTSAQFSYTQTGAPQPDFASTPTGGTISYAQPVATVGLPLGVQGIGINTETQQAVLVDPTTGGVVSLFSLIDQSVSTLTMKTNGVADRNGPTAVAFNPLTNTAVAVDIVSGALSVIDPVAPRRLNDSTLSFGLNGPVAVAIDPGTNLAVVANQSNNTVSILNLGAIKPFSITETNPKAFLTMSSLGGGPNPPSGVLIVIGKGLTCSNGSTNLSVRLDGVGLPTSCSGNGDRQLTTTVPFNKLLSARRFAVDVEDGSGNVTNAEDLTVEQSVDLSSTACPAPEPSGVAIDPQQDFAFVSMFGCDSVALINMGTGQVSTVKVGSHPMGVAVIPRLQQFAVANNGSGNATILDEGGNIKNTVTTGSGSMGAAADEATGEFAIANSVAQTVTVVNAVTGGTSTISPGQGPLAVAFNYVNHQIAVAAFTGNSLGISGGTAGNVNQTFIVNAPTSVIYDPVPTDCGSNSNGTTTNTVGCFIVNSSTGNSVNVIDPVSSVQIPFRIGINPTAIAYNFLTSTLVSTNSASRTVTVADMLGQKIRALLTFPPAPSGNSNLAISLAIAGSLQYALDIHPFTNIAVIADTANGRVLFLPLPR